ncbi:MAG TPA: hypothetical protein VNM72_02605 [Blastocatellia bacterium]|nr:hypothetical protein [Blastocatellia bacterium]
MIEPEQIGTPGGHPKIRLMVRGQSQLIYLQKMPFCPGDHQSHHQKNSHPELLHSRSADIAHHQNHHQKNSLPLESPATPARDIFDLGPGLG